MDKTMDKTIKEIIEAVEVIKKLNEEIYDMVNEDVDFFELHTIGHSTLIMFLNIGIWHSEDDEREYINEPQCKIEPLEQFLRREAQEIIDSIKKIDLLG